MKTPLLLPVLVWSTWLFLPVTARADTYDDAFGRSAAHEGRGDLDAAARELEAILPEYPQDYTLPVRLGWLRARQGHHAEAERRYRAALAVSPGVPEALLGLGWALARQGRCEEARAVFQQVAARRPDLLSSREGLALCAPQPSWSFVPGVAFQGQFFPSHPFKTYGVGGDLSLDVYHRGGFFLGGQARYLQVFGTDQYELYTWDQIEGYFGVGYRAPKWGIGLHYAVLYDGSGLFGITHHGGLSTRWSPFGDISLVASASRYPDMSVLRAELGWKIPIALGFSVRPGGSVIWTNPETMGSGSLTLFYEREAVAIWLGGKYGPEMRPAYLPLGVVYNTPDYVRWGLWAGFSVNVWRELRIHTKYALDRMEVDDSSGTQVFTHAVTLGATKAF